MTRTKVPAHLWRVPAYLPYVQPRLTDKRLAAAESELGVRLPRAYVAALRIQNGGYLRTTKHPKVPDSVDLIAGIGPRFPSIVDVYFRDVWAHLSTEEVARDKRKQNLLPFCGDGHYHLCFDYRRDGPRREPRVTYVDVGPEVIKVVAPDFATFLAALEQEDNGELGIVTDLDVARVAKKLGQALGCRFEAGDDQSNGYRVFRAQLAEPASVWLTPNLVPRAWAYKKDPEYRTLGKKKPPLARRAPDLEDCAVIAQTTGSREHLRSELEKVGFVTRDRRPRKSGR